MHFKGFLVFSIGLALFFSCQSEKQTILTPSGEYPLVACRYVPERLDDFSWENNLTAYRCYGPALKDSGENSGNDCWFKSVDYPVMEKLYQLSLKGKSYHSSRAGAYDPYHVGGSMGCGGTGLTDGETLFLSNVYTDWKILEQTATKAVFELSYFYENTVESQFKEVRRITIEADHYLYQTDVTIQRVAGDAVLMPVMGLTLHDGNADVERSDSSSFLAISEEIDGHFIASSVYPLTSDWQSKILNGNKKDDDHLIAILNQKVTDSAINYSFLSGYGWDGSGIKNIEQWIEVVQNEITSLERKEKP